VQIAPFKQNQNSPKYAISSEISIFLGSGPNPSPDPPVNPTFRAKQAFWRHLCVPRIPVRFTAVPVGCITWNTEWSVRRDGLLFERPGRLLYESDMTWMNDNEKQAVTAAAKFDVMKPGGVVAGANVQ